MPKPFYLTTPLYYVNARPHIGHAYTTIAADCLARWHRQWGQEVFLLTGTDEHGEKIAQAASDRKLSPAAFVEEGSLAFRALWEKFGISYDRFIRTTDPDHQGVVQKVLERLKEKGLLRLGTYPFWYCLPCETHFGLNEIPASKTICPNCKRPVSRVEEEDYFLPLEKYRPWLKAHIEKNEPFILPAQRRNEVLGLLNSPLPDLCITRPKERVGWGIEVPFSPGHVTYVWFDALMNYLSALGWPDDERFHRYWEEAGAVHLIGKDILRHHALYWPIILCALEVPPPRTIFAHGWWLVKGEKISKSKGNIVDPEAVIAAYGLDPLRYFLLRDVPFGEDGIFSEDSLRKRYNNDLANDLGNLVFRTLTMLVKHMGGRLPAGRSGPQIESQLLDVCHRMDAAFEKIAPDQALKALWELLRRANSLVEERAPWSLAREGKRKELEGFLSELVQILRGVALLLWPFMPQTAEAIWKQMGFGSSLAQEKLPLALATFDPGTGLIQKGKPLFPRLE